MTEAHASARARRSRSILLSGVAAGGARATAMVCSLLQVPLLLALLGAEGFGLYATLQAFIGIAGTLDLGLGYRLQNAVASHQAQGAPAEIRRAVRIVARLSASLALALTAAVFLPGSFFWAGVLGVNDPLLRSQVGSILPALLALGATSLPANLGLRLASGLQRPWLVGASQAVASVLTLGVLLACAGLHAPIALVLGATLAVPLLVNAFVLLRLWRSLPAAPAVAVAPGEIQRWVRESLPFFVPQISSALRTGAPPFLIATFISAAAVTPYSLITRLLNFISQPQNWLLEPLWPAYTDAATRGDHAWVRRALAWSFTGSIVWALVPMASVLSWGPWFIAWWAGYPAEAVGRGLLLWLVVAHAAVVITQPLTLCLNGLGQVRGQTIYGPISVVLGLAGTAWMCRQQDLNLAFAPLALLMAGFNLPCAAVDIRRLLRRPVATVTQAESAPR